MLKMDIEGSEYSALWQSIQDLNLHNVRQLVLEIHTRSHELLKAYTLLRALETFGFRKYFSHRNMGCKYNSSHTHNLLTFCHELYFININFLSKSINT